MDGDGQKGEGGEAPRGRRRRVLVVDDLRDSADSLAMLLRLIGQDVHTVYDGRQAMRAAEELRPEVVLLDIGMPEVSGYEVCRHIRGQPWGGAVFIIALTGWGQEDDRRTAREAGFDHHLVKPVDPEELMALLDGLPERRETG
jgi:CheY-like chemotaxis protein